VPESQVPVAVAVAFRVLGLSTRGYYKWLTSPVTQRDWDDTYLITAAFQNDKAEPEFGYRLTRDEPTEAGHQASGNRVARLCSSEGIFWIHAKKRGRTRKPSLAVHVDLLAHLDVHRRTRHDFTNTSPNRKWLIDISKQSTTWFPAFIATLERWGDRHTKRIRENCICVR
jgi:hypothetical protein